MYWISTAIAGALRGRLEVFTCAALLAAASLFSLPAAAQTPITLFQNFVGHVNYQATGNSLRSAPNTTDACSLTGSSSATVSNIPVGATILAGYLYWAGSGSTPDNTVTLNGSSVSADRSFTDTFVFNGNNYNFFSGFADVTSQVSGNGNYTFSGLSVDNGGIYCGSQAVVSGWSLVVVYEDASEDLRAVNIFDGFRLFRASALTLTVDNYRIPAAPINGKITPISWEGDPQNSGSSGGFSESLTFNGNLLDDGLVPPASSPSVQQYDGTVNTAGTMTSHGVDVDTYDVSAFLSAGATTATTTYSSGSDLVLLSAEIISFTTEPYVDLSISKSHTGDFAVGSQGDYTIVVGNFGIEDENDVVTVTDTLPAGLSYAAFSGTGWSCGAAGADVTCTHPGPIPVGASLPDLTITVDVSGAAAPDVTNTATVSSGSSDNDPSNNSVSDFTVVAASDLSTSTKSVVDLNGGDADPGDTLRYTITLNESAGIAATNVSVTDDIPALIGSWSIVSLPSGATNNSTGAGTGANGTGLLDVSTITVPAGGSVDVVFDVVIAGAANPGDIIANTAVVTNPDGIDGNPIAPDVTVSISSIPSGGTKTLYLFDTSTADPNGFNAGSPPWLSRTPPSGAQNAVTITRTNTVTWTMTPALQAPLTIDAGSIPITIFASRNGGGSALFQRRLVAELTLSGAASGTLGSAVTQTFSAPSISSATEVTFNIPLGAVTTLPAGTVIHLSLTNTTPSNATRNVLVRPVFNGENSRIDMEALTVINVDSAQSFDAAFPGGTAGTSFTPGANISLRANVSDPFGTFDISAVNIDILDNTGGSIVSGDAMTQVGTVNGSTAQYEYLFSIPAGSGGNWTWRVTAIEGTEGTVTHQRTAQFSIATPMLTFTKSVSVISDPFNGGTNPKSVPGAVMLYSVTLANSGGAGADAGSLEITDTLPAETALFVDTSSGDPIVFIDGTPSSGLSLNFATDVRYSNQPGGGAPYNYSPTPDAQGFDTSVTGFSVTPTGAMLGSSGSGSPSFTLRYRTRVE